MADLNVISNFAKHMFEFLYQNNDNELMASTQIKKLYEQYREDHKLPNEKPKMANKVLIPLLCEAMNNTSPGVATAGVHLLPVGDGTDRKRKLQAIKFNISLIDEMYEIPLPDWIELPDDPYMERVMNGVAQYRHHNAYITKKVKYFLDNVEEFSEWKKIDRTNAIPYQPENPMSNIFVECTTEQAMNTRDILVIGKVETELQRRGRLRPPSPILYNVMEDDTITAEKFRSYGGSSERAVMDLWRRIMDSTAPLPPDFSVYQILEWTKPHNVIFQFTLPNGERVRSPGHFLPEMMLKKKRIVPLLIKYSSSFTDFSTKKQKTDDE